MRWDLHGKIVLLGKLLLDNPRCTSPSFLISRVLDKGSKSLLGKDLPLTRDMLFVSYYLIARSLIELYEVATKGFPFNSAIGPLQLWKFGFGSNRTCVALNVRAEFFAFGFDIE